MPSRETRVKIRNAIRGDVSSEELYGIVQETLGQVLYVSSITGASTNPGDKPSEPLATIDQAINKCVPNQGDVVVVMPGHAETIAAAGGVTMDIAGVSVVGLGRGTDRPQLTFSATASTVVVSAANCLISNIHFINDIDSLVVGIPVTAAHVRVTNCLFDDATASKQTLHWVTLSADADYFECINCDHHGSDTAGATGFITMAAADHVKIVNLKSHGDFSAGNIIATAAPTDILIENCKLENLNAVDVCIELFSAATGWLVGNSYMIATDAQTSAVNTPGSVGQFESYFVNVGGEAGKIQGTVSA